MPDPNTARPAVVRATSGHALDHHDPFKISPTSASIFDEAHKSILRAGDEVWHNPSIDQIAGALRGAMAAKAVNEPLPVEFNGHVHFLLEGYDAVRQEASGAEAERERHKAVEEHWMIQEARYKTEVKRLEVFIHDLAGDNGLEAVAMARAGSLIRARQAVVVDEARPGGSQEYPGSQTQTETETQNQAQVHGRQASILSRRRTTDTSAEMRWSRRLEGAKTKTKTKTQSQDQTQSGGTKSFEDGPWVGSVPKRGFEDSGSGQSSEFSFVRGDDKGVVRDSV